MIIQVLIHGARIPDELPVVPVGDTGTIPHHLCHHFPECLVTTGRVPAMDVVCGLSNRGHWVGPVICNEAGRAVCASDVPHGDKLRVNSAPKHHFWGTLLSTLMGQGQL
jgi:hypothetical protein